MLLAFFDRIWAYIDFWLVSHLSARQCQVLKILGLFFCWHVALFLFIWLQAFCQRNCNQALNYWQLPVLTWDVVLFKLLEYDLIVVCVIVLAFVFLVLLLLLVL